MAYRIKKAPLSTDVQFSCYLRATYESAFKSLLLKADLYVALTSKKWLAYDQVILLHCCEVAWLPWGLLLFVVVNLCRCSQDHLFTCFNWHVRIICDDVLNQHSSLYKTAVTAYYSSCQLLQHDVAQWSMAGDTYLDPVLWEVRLQGEHFSLVDVRILGVLEGLLQLLQLVAGEYSPEHIETRIIIWHWFMVYGLQFIWFSSWKHAKNCTISLLLIAYFFKHVNNFGWREQVEMTSTRPVNHYYSMLSLGIQSVVCDTHLSGARDTLDAGGWYAEYHIFQYPSLQIF